MTTAVIIAGTYEGGVVGFEVSIADQTTVEVEQIVSTQCHIGCVRSSSSAGRYAATGGSDEMINVFDVKRRTQLGTLGGSIHTSTITALAVCNSPALLVSGSEEGQIAITRIKDCKTLRSFKGHQSAVLDIAMHPTGRVALSISSDNTLRMWDLTRGTCAAVRKISDNKRVIAPSMMVRYTPEGSRYCVILSSGMLEVCSSGSMDVAQMPGPFTSVCPVSENLFVAGNSKGHLMLIHVNEECTELSVLNSTTDIHSSRLRGLARLSATLFASVCADGNIVISHIDRNKISQIRAIETGMRITSFTSNV